MIRSEFSQNKYKGPPVVSHGFPGHPPNFGPTGPSRPPGYPLEFDSKV